VDCSVAFEQKDALRQDNLPFSSFVFPVYFHQLQADFLSAAFSELLNKLGQF
jgi:hypothetical protein